MPVSSRTSRAAASIGVSPGSTWPLGSASTREPSAARRVGTITATSPSRTTTPPAENSRERSTGRRLPACPRLAPWPRLAPFLGLEERLEDILLQRLGVVHDQTPAALGDHPCALEHREKAACGLARGAGELSEIGLGRRDQHVGAALADRDLLL